MPKVSDHTRLQQRVLVLRSHAGPANVKRHKLYNTSEFMPAVGLLAPGSFSGSCGLPFVKGNLTDSMAASVSTF